MEETAGRLLSAPRSGTTLQVLLRNLGWPFALDFLFPFQSVDFTLWLQCIRHFLFRGVCVLSPAGSEMWPEFGVFCWTRLGVCLLGDLLQYAQSCLTLCDPLDLAPLSMEFSRQECWSGLPFPSPGHLPDPGIEPTTLVSPALQVNSLPLVPPGKPLFVGW